MARPAGPGHPGLVRTWIGLGAVLTLVAVEAGAVPADPTAGEWVVMPVRAETPPPRDPTLLRLSAPVAKTIADALPSPVRLVKRDTRDAQCADDGWRCPDEIAAMMSVARVVSLHLDDDHARLKVMVYAGRHGVVAETVVKCGSRAGRVRCDRDAIATFIRNAAQAELPKRVPVELPL